MDMKVKSVDKQYLRDHARDILLRGPLTPALIDRFLADGTVDDPDVVIQVSSGSTGRPLLIPRTRRDVGDIARRVWTPLVERFGRPPARIALIGGISHSQAAMKLDLGEISIRSFEPGAIADLVDFDPVVISCYPSIVRELLRDLPVAMPGLSAFKLGGERIFQADLDKIFCRFPGTVVIEQFGSTEVPAVAVRVLEEGKQPPYQLQPERFQYEIAEGDGWHPLLVKDQFEGLLFPIGAFYETGDEVLVEGMDIVEVRRIGDKNAEYYSAAELLLAGDGCINIQFRPDRREVIFAGSHAPHHVDVNEMQYRVIEGEPVRIKPSNKLPLVAPE